MNAQPVQDAAPPLAEGRYRLIEVLGAGGMAMVYRGFDSRLQVARAIKILSPALAMRPKIRARFEAEARTMALLEHRNIVRVYDVGSDGDRAYIVMEVVDGGSLIDRITEHGPLPPRMALDVTIDVLKALEVAHGRGVVHRDIKPHNVLVTSDGEIRVTDFGIARLAQTTDDSMTKTGAVMGTWAYMAPEQRVNAKGVDATADVYSVGAMLFSLVTGDTPADLFAAALDASLLASVPPDLHDVITHATRYKREERFPDTASMTAAIEEVRARLPANPSDVPPLARKKPKPALTIPGPSSAPTPATLAPAEATRGGGETFAGFPMSEPAAAGGAILPASAGAGADAAVQPVSAERPAPPPIVTTRPPPASERRPSEGTVLPWDDDDHHPPKRRNLGLILAAIAAVGIALVVVPAGLGGAWLAFGDRSDDEGEDVAAAEAAEEEADAPPDEAKPEPVREEEAPAVAVASAAPAAEPAVARTTARSAGASASAAGPAATPRAATPAVAAPSAPEPERAAPPKAEASGPTLSHTPVSRAQVGGTLTVAATIRGSSDYDQIYVRYRPAGTAKWSQAAMFPSGGAFSTRIAVDATMAAGIEYFIDARSSKGTAPQLRSGSNTSPHKVAVE